MPTGDFEMEEPPGKRNPVASLTDNILVKILSRLPVRSVCRFKCVSRSWRNLITHRDHRKKLPQTLAGFFYTSFSGERFPIKAHHFTNVTGKGIRFIFPPSRSCLSPVATLSSSIVAMVPSSAAAFSLVLLTVTSFRRSIAVCNPATEKWLMLPDGSWASGEARTASLCFDPTVSPHFHVIEYVVDEEDYVTRVDIYSSKTGSWSPVESG